MVSGQCKAGKGHQCRGKLQYAPRGGLGLKLKRLAYHPQLRQVLVLHAHLVDCERAHLVDCEHAHLVDCERAHLVDCEHAHLVDCEHAHLVDCERAHLVDCERALLLRPCAPRTFM